MLIGVRTTGVVCRPGCPGRPHARNVTVLPDLAAARRAGLRPCRRCRPDTEPAAAGPVRLGTRRPFDGDAVLRFLAARAIPGVEEVAGRSYMRGGLRIDVRPDGIDVHGTDIIGAARLFDLEADAPAIDAHLGRDPWLAALVAARPGLRSPGILSEHEAWVRAIIGQQISVKAARTILGRLCPDGRFPTREELAERDPATLPMPRARAETLVRAMADGPERTKGIGPWTRAYVAMRSGDRDAWPANDLYVRRLGLEPRRAERWRPYRAHALHHLWLAA